MNKHLLKLLILGLTLNSIGYADENTTSKIDIDISMKKSIVEDIINNQLPYTIEDSGSGNQIFNGNKNNLLGVGLDLLGAVDKKFSQFSESFIWAYKINRSPVNFSAQEQKVQAVTNIDGLFKASWSRNSQNTEIALNGTAGISSIISISTDWQINANSSPFLNISNDNLPLNLNLYGFNFKTDINIGDSLEKSIVSKLAQATKELDSKIQSFNLKELVEKYWLKFKEPILVNPEYNLWLTVDPTSARYSNLVTTESDLGIKVGTDVNLHLYFGDKPAPLNLTTLPSMNFGFVNDSFNIILPVSTSYKSLNEIINKNFNNKKIEIFSGISSTIKNVNLSSKDSTLYATSEFDFSILGFLHPTATVVAHLKPNFDQTTGTLTGNDFDYTLETNSFILKIANSIFKNKIINTVKTNYLSFNPASEIKLAQDYLQKKVENIELEKNVNLKSTIDTFKIVNLKIDDEFISATLNTTGKSTLEISQ
ncbi:DUF4403 family protein (plasmid) [Cetobacterium somerae]|uniref:DUF4403 family protein n=1 Tax=Cetobacterium somerae TaxID=188913 RepID=UPI003D7689EB